MIQDRPTFFVREADASGAQDRIIEVDGLDVRCGCVLATLDVRGGTGLVVGLAITMTSSGQAFLGVLFDSGALEIWDLEGSYTLVDAVQMPGRERLSKALGAAAASRLAYVITGSTTLSTPVLYCTPVGGTVSNPTITVVRVHPSMAIGQQRLDAVDSSRRKTSVSAIACHGSRPLLCVAYADGVLHLYETSRAHLAEDGQAAGGGGGGKGGGGGLDGPSFADDTEAGEDGGPSIAITSNSQLLLVPLLCLRASNLATGSSLSCVTFNPEVDVITAGSTAGDVLVWAFHDLPRDAPVTAIMSPDNGFAPFLSTLLPYFISDISFLKGRGMMLAVVREPLPVSSSTSNPSAQGEARSASMDGSFRHVRVVLFAFYPTFLGPVHIGNRFPEPLAVFFNERSSSFLMIGRGSSAKGITLRAIPLVNDGGSSTDCSYLLPQVLGCLSPSQVPWPLFLKSEAATAAASSFKTLTTSSTTSSSSSLSQFLAHYILTGVTLSPNPSIKGRKQSSSSLSAASSSNNTTSIQLKALLVAQPLHQTQKAATFQSRPSTFVLPTSVREVEVAMKAAGIEGISLSSFNHILSSSAYGGSSNEVEAATLLLPRRLVASPDGSAIVIFLNALPPQPSRRYSQAGEARRSSASNITHSKEEGVTTTMEDGWNGPSQIFGPRTEAPATSLLYYLISSSPFLETSGRQINLVQVGVAADAVYASSRHLILLNEDGLRVKLFTAEESHIPTESKWVYNSETSLEYRAKKIFAAPEGLDGRSISLIYVLDLSLSQRISLGLVADDDIMHVEMGPGAEADNSSDREVIALSRKDGLGIYLGGGGRGSGQLASSALVLKRKESVLQAIWQTDLGYGMSSSSSASLEKDQNHQTQSTLLAVLTTQRILLVSRKLVILRALILDEKLKVKSLAWLGPVLTIVIGDGRVLYVDPDLRRGNVGARQLCSIDRRQAGAGLTLLGAFPDRLIYAAKTGMRGATRLLTRPLQTLEPLLIGVMSLPSLVEDIKDTSGLADLLQNVVESYGPGWLEGAGANVIGGSGFKYGVGEGPGKNAGCTGLACVALCRQGLFDLAATIAGISTDAHSQAHESFRKRPWIPVEVKAGIAAAKAMWWEAMLEVLGDDPAVQDYALNPDSIKNAALPPKYRHLSQALMILGNDAKRCGQLEAALRLNDVAGQDEDVISLLSLNGLAHGLNDSSVTLLRDLFAAKASPLLQAYINDLFPSSGIEKSNSQQTVEQLGVWTFEDALSGKQASRWFPSASQRRASLLPSASPGNELPSWPKESDAPLVSLPSLTSATDVSNGPPRPPLFGRLLLDRVEEWLGRFGPEVFEDERGFGGGIAGGRGGSGIGASEDQEWIKGVGEGRDEGDNVVMYWRFSELSPAQATLATPGIQQRLTGDLSQYSNVLEVAADHPGAITFVESASSVDQGDEAKVRPLMDVVWSTNAINDQSLTSIHRGLIVKIKRGSALDLGPYHSAVGRTKLTVEFWVQRPASSSQTNDVLVSRMTDDEPASRLWSLIVAPDGTLVLKAGDCVSSSDENGGGSAGDQIRSAAGALEAGRWTHLAFTLESKGRVGSQASGGLFVGGKEAGSGQLQFPSISEFRLRSTIMAIGLNLSGYRMTEVRVWALTRSAEDLYDNRESYLKLAEKRRRLAFKIRSGPGVGGLEQQEAASTGSFAAPTLAGTAIGLVAANAFAQPVEGGGGGGAAARRRRVQVGGQDGAVSPAPGSKESEGSEGAFTPPPLQPTGGSKSGRRSRSSPTSDLDGTGERRRSTTPQPVVEEAQKPATSGTAAISPASSGWVTPASSGWAADFDAWPASATSPVVFSIAPTPAPPSGASSSIEGTNKEGALSQSNNGTINDNASDKSGKIETADTSVGVLSSARQPLSALDKRRRNLAASKPHAPPMSPSSSAVSSLPPLLSPTRQPQGQEQPTPPSLPSPSRVVEVPVAATAVHADRIAPSSSVHPHVILTAKDLEIDPENVLPDVRAAAFSPGATYVCLRERSSFNKSKVGILLLALGVAGQSLPRKNRYPFQAESAIMMGGSSRSSSIGGSSASSPSSSRIACYTVSGGGTTTKGGGGGGPMQGVLQVYDLGQRKGLAQQPIQTPLSFWCWLSEDKLALVTPQAIFAWIVSGVGAGEHPIKLFNRRDNLPAGQRVLDYHHTDEDRWAILTSETEHGLIVQLHDFQRGVTYLESESGLVGANLGRCSNKEDGQVLLVLLRSSSTDGTTTVDIYDVRSPLEKNDATSPTPPLTTAITISLSSTLSRIASLPLPLLPSRVLNMATIFFPASMKEAISILFREGGHLYTCRPREGLIDSTGSVFHNSSADTAEESSSNVRDACLDLHGDLIVLQERSLTVIKVPLG